MPIDNSVLAPVPFLQIPQAWTRGWLWTVVAAGMIGMAGTGGMGCRSGKVPDVPSALEQAAAYSDAHGGHALLVWQDGAMRLAHYAPGAAPGDRHTLADASILFASLVVLAATDRGRIDLDAPASTVLAEWADDPVRDAITIRQLLHGTSGLGGTVREVPTTAKALTVPLVHPPGEGFHYGAPMVQAAWAVIERHPDIPGSALKFWVLNPMGIEGGYWTAVQGDMRRGLNAAYGANLTAREWLRVGRLLLQNGTWEGKTILRDLTPLTQPSEPAPAFGLGVWLNAPVPQGHPFRTQLPIETDRLPFHPVIDGPGGMIDADGPSDLYMAAGGGGQRLYIVPSRHLVVVRLGSSTLQWSDAAFLSRLFGAAD